MTEKPNPSLLANSHPKEQWNLLVRSHQDKPLIVREYPTYEQARAEQERRIKTSNPQWTAVVRDKKGQR